MKRQSVYGSAFQSLLEYIFRKAIFRNSVTFCNCLKNRSRFLPLLIVYISIGYTIGRGFQCITKNISASGLLERRFLSTSARSMITDKAVKTLSGDRMGTGNCISETVTFYDGSNLLELLVPPAGIGPAAHGLGIQCSIH